MDLHAPEKLRAEPANALVTTAEYFAAVADRSGMEAAYDDERHKALHFEQATELKDHHIERLEAEFRKLRQRVETGEQQVAALAARERRATGHQRALSEELRTSTRTAAPQPATWSRRHDVGLPGRQPGQAQP